MSTAPSHPARLIPSPCQHREPGSNAFLRSQRAGHRTTLSSTDFTVVLTCRRCQSGRAEHVAPRDRRYERRHPRLRRGSCRQTAFLQPDRTAAADHPEPPPDTRFSSPGRPVDEFARTAVDHSRRSVDQPQGSPAVKYPRPLAVALNVTAVDAAGRRLPHDLRRWAPQPNTSSVNFSPGEASPNAVLTQDRYRRARPHLRQRQRERDCRRKSGWFGTGGRDRLFYRRSRPIDRHSLRRWSCRGPARARRPGRGTLRVPVGTTAAVLNVTATGAVCARYLTVYPSDKATPMSRP